MTFYDDGLENVRLVSHELVNHELPDNYVRAYKLHNGDIFSVNDVSIEYELGNFYEVISVEGFYIGETKYKRTGKMFAIEEIKKIADR